MKLAPYFKVSCSQSKCDKYRWAKDVPWGRDSKTDHSILSRASLSTHTLKRSAANYENKTICPDLNVSCPSGSYALKFVYCIQLTVLWQTWVTLLRSWCNPGHVRCSGIVFCLFAFRHGRVTFPNSIRSSMQYNTHWLDAQATSQEGLEFNYRTPASSLFPSDLPFLSSDVAVHCGMCEK